MTHCVEKEKRQLFMLPSNGSGAHANDEGDAFNDLVDKSWIDGARN